MLFYFAISLLSVVRLRKKILHLYSDWVDLYSIRYIIESVFALSLSENVEVFNDNRTTDNTHSLYSYVAMHLLVYLPHTIQVWGIASFILT